MKGVRGEERREEQKEKGEGDYKAGSMKGRKESKRKGKGGVMALKSMHDLSGNGWSG